MTKRFKKQIIAGAILAGGKASRMGGIVKGALKTANGITIVEHLLHELRVAGIHPVVILANDPQPYREFGVQIFQDIRIEIGPAGGIETGLIRLKGQCDAVMFVPCDMPNLTAREIVILKDVFVKSQTPVVCAESDDFFWHPLCAVVHIGSIRNISSAIDRGEIAVHSLWKQLGVERVHFDEERAFMNLNTVSDVEQWQKDRDEKTNFN